MRNSPANTKVREEGGREGAPGTGAEISLQPPESTMMKQIFSLGRIPQWSGCTCPEGRCSLLKGPLLKLGNSMRRKEQMRGAVMD